MIKEGCPPTHPPLCTQSAAAKICNNSNFSAHLISLHQQIKMVKNFQIFQKRTFEVQAPKFGPVVVVVIGKIVLAFVRESLLLERQNKVK